VNLIEIAEELQMEGLNPFPLNDDKSPQLPQGHNFLYQPIDNIEKRFKRAKKIGIACGDVSGGFTVIDFDAHNSEPIKDIFDEYIKIDVVQNLLKQGKISVYTTMSGGYHIYCKFPNKKIETKALSMWETKAVMIEVRSTGAYVACYPSQGYEHLMGVEYTKLTDMEEDWEFDSLKDLAVSFNKYKLIVNKHKSNGNKKWAENWKATTPDGKFNLEYEDEAIDLLVKFGWQYVFERNDGTQYWVRPNKDIKEGFSATFNHFKGMFYVFSSDGNCLPFQQGQAYSPFNILTLLKYEGDWKRAKDDLRKRFNMVDDEEFWSKNEKGNFSLNNYRFKNFLEQNDFFKQSPNEASTFDFIQKDGIFLKIVYEKDIKDFVLEWIEENQCDEGVFNLMTGNLKFFKRDYLSMLKSKEIKTLKDEPDCCYLFYKNCVVKINKDKKEILSYTDIDLSIWKDQVIDRDYLPTDHHHSEYRTFIWKIAGENKEKYKAFQTVIGYLLHSYKSNSNNKAIIFNDEIISENPNGRSGKGLFWNALKQIKKVQSLDGKTFDFNKSFPYQSVSTDCQVLVFDDVKKNFNFENLFSVITEGITIEYKGKDSIKLDVTESPKIIITTNYTIKGDSPSYNARKYEVEMSSYFNDKYTPEQEFGHQLFNNWDADEWARFDNYMMECIKIYLKNGLIDMPLKNLAYRKLIDKITIEMHHFFDGLKRNEWLNIKDVYNQLFDRFPELRKQNPSQNKMTTNFKEYCEYHKLKYDIRYSAGVGKLIINEEETPDPF